MLAVLQRNGHWVQVSLNKKNGWVSKYSVSKSPPIQNKISLFGRIKNFFKPKSNRNRVSVVSTAGGIRGLADGEVDSSGNHDQESLERLETLEISSEELRKFIESNEQ